MAKNLTKNNGFVFSVAKDFPHDENHHEMLGMILSIFLHQDVFYLGTIVQLYTTTVTKNEQNIKHRIKKILSNAMIK